MWKPTGDGFGSEEIIFQLSDFDLVKCLKKGVEVKLAYIEHLPFNFQNQLWKVISPFKTDQK